MSGRFVRGGSSGSRRGLNLMRGKRLVKMMMVRPGKTGLCTIGSTELHEVQQTGFKGSRPADGHPSGGVGEVSEY